MWRGEFEFGEFWAAYSGSTDSNRFHAHVALQLAVGVDGAVEVDLGDRALHSRGVLIAPLARHRVAAGVERVAFRYVEPQIPLGRALRRLCGAAPAVELPVELCALAVRTPNAGVEALGRSLGVAQAPALDSRLAGALEHLAAPGDSVASAARAVGLSSSQLRRLARDALGVPLARWVLWRKLERAGRALAAGASLVEAAAAGPFSDQAHLSRTLRRLFGVTPSDAARAIRSRPGSA